jgi:hypothetical protein
MEPPIIVQVEMPQMLTWAAGLMALTLVAIALRIENIATRMKDVSHNVYQLKSMHEHPDDHGFGTRATDEMLSGLVEACSSNCRQSEKVWRSIDRLAHYIAHDIESRTGRPPPPPPPVPTQEARQP